MPHPGRRSVDERRVWSGRDTACFEPWRKREQVASSLYVIVGTVLGLVKVRCAIALSLELD
jgi:hypothetical protein